LQLSEKKMYVLHFLFESEEDSSWGSLFIGPIRTVVFTSKRYWLRREMFGYLIFNYYHTGVDVLCNNTLPFLVKSLWLLCIRRKFKYLLQSHKTMKFYMLCFISGIIMLISKRVYLNAQLFLWNISSSVFLIISEFWVLYVTTKFINKKSLQDNLSHKAPWPGKNRGEKNTNTKKI